MTLRPPPSGALGRRLGARPKRRRTSQKPSRSRCAPSQSAYAVKPHSSHWAGRASGRFGGLMPPAGGGEGQREVAVDRTHHGRDAADRHPPVAAAPGGRPSARPGVRRPRPRRPPPGCTRWSRCPSCPPGASRGVEQLGAQPVGIARAGQSRAAGRPRPCRCRRSRWPAAIGSISSPIRSSHMCEIRWMPIRCSASLPGLSRGRSSCSSAASRLDRGLVAPQRGEAEVDPRQRHLRVGVAAAGREPGGGRGSVDVRRAVAQLEQAAGQQDRAPRPRRPGPLPPGWRWRPSWASVEPEVGVGRGPERLPGGRAPTRPAGPGRRSGGPSRRPHRRAP